MVESIHSRKRRGYRRLCGQPFRTEGLSARPPPISKICPDVMKKQRLSGSGKKLNALPPVDAGQV